LQANGRLDRPSFAHLGDHLLMVLQYRGEIAALDAPAIIAAVVDHQLLHVIRSNDIGAVLETGGEEDADAVAGQDAVDLGEAAVRLAREALYFEGFEPVMGEEARLLPVDAERRKAKPDELAVRVGVGLIRAVRLQT